MIKTMPLSGAARPVTDSIKRAMAYLKDKPDPCAPERKETDPQPGDVRWRPQGHRH